MALEVKQQKRWLTDEDIARIDRQVAGLPSPAPAAGAAGRCHRCPGAAPDARAATGPRGNVRPAPEIAGMSARICCDSGPACGRLTVWRWPVREGPGCQWMAGAPRVFPAKR